MITLKPVQVDCIAAIWKELTVSNDILIQLPTGTGKTIIFVELIRMLMEKYPELKSNVLVNKIKLVEQTKEKLMYAIGEEKIGLYCGSLGEYQSNSPITVGSIQSISMTTQLYNLLIIDEAHNAEEVATYDTYIDRLRKANERLKIVRFTATPFTMKGYIYGPDKPIKKLTFKRTLLQTIADGDQVPPTFKSVKQSFDTSQLRVKRGEYIAKDVEKMSKDAKKVALQVEDALPRLIGRKKIVWAATCIDHANLILNELQLQDPMVRTCIVHSKLSDKQRAENLDAFEKGSGRHLISIQIVTEGYDYPPIDAIVIMVATRSPVKYVQLIGRGLRPIYLPGFDLTTQAGRLAMIQASDKKDCLVLDYGEVVGYFGHPSDPFVPNAGKKNTPAERKVVICPACETINFLPRRECEKCSYQFLQADKNGKVQHTKALTNQASDVQFNDKGFIEYELPVILAEMNDKYVAKSGNECIHLKFTTMEGIVNEFIKKGTSWHRTFNTEMLQHKKLPIRIIVEKQGKYLTVKKRIYV